MYARSSRNRRQGVWRLGAPVLLLFALVFGLTACSDDGNETSTGNTSDTTAGDATAETVRLGYFANVTHAPAIIGVENGLFDEQLGDTKLESVDLQRGPRGDRGDLRRCPRHVVHRSEPGHQRLRAVERRGRPHRVRQHVGRCVVWS